MSTPSDRPAAQGGVAPFSRLLNVDDVPDDGLAMTIKADPAEGAAVADAIDLPAVLMISASYRVTRLAGGRIQVEGTVQARITQVCVISLDPFDSVVSQPVAVAFAPPKAPLPERHGRSRNDRNALRREAEFHKAHAALPVDDDGEVDPPDPIFDGRIDLGVVTVEFLTLALDFYPKKPGVHFSDVLIDDTDEPKPSTFAALERFKDRS